MLHEHILIVLHRALARWAPGRPEIEQDDFTLFMLNTFFATRHILGSIDFLEHVSDILRLQGHGLGYVLNVTLTSKFGYLAFKVDRGWVSSPYDSSLLIDKRAVRDFTYLKICTSFISALIVLWIRHSLLLYVRCNLLRSVVPRQSNNSNVFPDWV